MGHEERFPPPRLSGRYGFSKETGARVPGSDRDAFAVDTVLAVQR
jgi:hypothetical protein